MTDRSTPFAVCSRIVNYLPALLSMARPGATPRYGDLFILCKTETQLLSSSINTDATPRCRDDDFHPRAGMPRSFALCPEISFIYALQYALQVIKTPPQHVAGGSRTHGKPSAACGALAQADQRRSSSGACASPPTLMTGAVTASFPASRFHRFPAGDRIGSERANDRACRVLAPPSL